MDVKQFSPIYIGSDQWSFGIYCLANQIPHVYIEDASGMLSQRERYMKITREISLTNYVISQYLHGAGTSEYETARLCDMRNFVPGFTDEKAVNFFNLRRPQRRNPPEGAGNPGVLWGKSR